jgi:hypothetical protein
LSETCVTIDENEIIRAIGWEGRGAVIIMRADNISLFEKWACACWKSATACAVLECEIIILGNYVQINSHVGTELSADHLICFR